MKEGVTNRKKIKNMSITIRVVLKYIDCNFNEREKDDVFGYGLVEIEVEIINKIIFHVIMDDGNNVNIM
jgi:hypothetical protein